MSSDERARLLDAVTGAIAGEVVGAVRRRTANSSLARQLRDTLGIDRSNQKTKDLVAGALSDAAGRSGAPWSLIKRFAEHPDNQKAIARLIADPSADPVLATTMAVGAEEKKQLRSLTRNLRTAVDRAVDLQVSPEGKRVLNAVQNAHAGISDDVRSEGERTREHLERLLEERLPVPSPLPRNAGTLVELGYQPDDTPSTDVAASGVAVAEEAKEAGRHRDAAREAKLVVADYEGRTELTDEDRDQLRRAHRVLADLYIADPNSALRARPHLEAMLRLWNGTPEGRLANRSLLRLFSDDPEGALRTAEEALATDPDNSTAKGVKANALVRLGRATEAVALYGGEDYGSLSMRAWLLRMGHEYAAARHAAREALQAAADEEAPAPPTLATQVFAEATLLGLAPDYEYGARRGSPESDGVIREAIGYLDGLLDTIDEQRPSARADALLYRATLREWAGIDGVREDLEEAVHLQPDNERALRNLIVLLASREEFERAAHLAERLQDLDGSHEASRLKASIDVQAGRLDQAIATLEPLASDPSASPDAAEAALILADAYATALRTTDAERTLDLVEASGHAPFGVVHARVRQALRSGRRADTIPLLDEIVTAPPPVGEDEQGRRELGRWRLAHLMLGEALHAAGDAARAADLLAPFVDADRPDETLLAYAAALLNAGRDAECLAVCERALASMPPSSDLAVELESVAAAVYMNLGAFVDAAERYARILPGRPHRTRDLVAYGNALVRLGQLGRALDVLRLAEARVPDDPAKLAIIANAYADAGGIARALDLAYRALDLAPDDERFHRNYAGLFIFHGDEISEAGPLDKKYLDRFHDILHNHATRFPNDAAFVRMESLPEDPDEMVEKLIEMVRPAHEARKTVRGRLLRGGRAPLSSIADLFHRNSIEAWEAVTSKPEWGRLAYPGDAPSRTRSAEVARTQDSVVADPSALLTLHGLGLLRAALRSFDEVLVPQGFVDELHHALDSDHAGSDGQRLYMGLSDDGHSLAITEVPEELALRYRNRIEDLYETITHAATDPDQRLCRIVGRPPGPLGAVAGGDPEKFIEVLGDAGHAAVVAEARNLPLLSDGFMVRLEAEKAGVATTDSYGVLGRLIERGAITPVRREDALLQLIEWGYRYVSMSADTLFRAVVRARALLTSRSRSPFDYLADEESEPVSATNVVRFFLLRLWSMEVDGPLPQNVVRKQWTALAYLTLARLVSPHWALKAIVGVVRGRLGPSELLADDNELYAAIREGHRLWLESE